MKKLKIIAVLMVSLVFCQTSVGQVGIGTVSPDASAMLEIRSTNSGLLIPRMTLAERNTIPNPATGLLIYQIDAGNTFFFYNGTTWEPLLSSNIWTTAGNLGTDPSINLLGTSENQDFVIRANAIEVFRITANGTIALGPQVVENLVYIESTTTPALAINDGNQAVGNVLTSDAQGNASWVDPEDFANVADGDWAYVNPNLNENTDPIARTGRVLIGRNPIATGVNVRTLLDVQLDEELLGTSIGLGSTEYYTDLASQFTFSNDLVPITDNSIPIGNATNRWNEVFATNDVINTSDLRDKKFIEDIEYGLKELLLLNPVSFQWNEKVVGTKSSVIKNEKKLGFLAQELQETLPEVVQEFYWTRQKDGTYQKENKKLAVSYSEFLPVIVKSIQEHQELIDILKEQEETINKLLKQ